MATPPGPFVKSISRVGTRTVLLPAVSALVFDPATITITYEPDAVTTDARGATVTGRCVVSARGASSTVGASFLTTATSRILIVFHNDTGGSVDVGSLVFVPTDAIAADSDTNYWEAAWSLGSAISTPVCEVTSKLTGGVAFAAGEALPVSGTVTIPAGDTLVCQLRRNGTATTMGGLFQGRLA